MEKKPLPISRKNIILNLIIVKQSKVKKTSKAFKRSQHLLDIAVLGAIIIKDSKIEIWINFVEGVFEMNGGSNDEILELVSPGFHLLMNFFDLRSDILIDEAILPDYQISYKHRIININKRDIKTFRQKINKKLLLFENDLPLLVGEYENFLYLFFDSILPPNNEKKNIEIDSLKEIWILEPRSTINEVLEVGKRLSLWSKDYKITTTRKSPFSTGKKLLAGLYISFKGYSINENIDYKVVGKVLCEFFDIKENETTKEPYKSFQSIDPKLRNQFDKFFK